MNTDSNLKYKLMQFRSTQGIYFDWHGRNISPLPPEQAELMLQIINQFEEEEFQEDMWQRSR